MKLLDKIVMVTGTTSGIGASCAKQFAAQGAHIIITGRRTERLVALQQQLEQAHSIRVYPITLDVRDYEAVVQAVVNLPQEFREVDIVINNAGLAAGWIEIAHGSVEDWEQMIDTNIKGLLYITKALLPGMLKRGQGHVINIGSIAGRYAYAKGNVYCATKYAVKAISRSLAQECIGTGVKVTDIAPGACETEFSLVRFKGDHHSAKAVYEGFTPMTPDDVADAVLFCATRPAHVNVPDMVVLATNQSVQLV